MKPAWLEVTRQRVKDEKRADAKTTTPNYAIANERLTLLALVEAMGEALAKMAELPACCPIAAFICEGFYGCQHRPEMCPFVGVQDMYRRGPISMSSADIAGRRLEALD